MKLTKRSSDGRWTPERRRLNLRPLYLLALTLAWLAVLSLILPMD